MMQRIASYLVMNDQLAEEIAWLNANGWIVTSGRLTNRTNEVALRCIYVGDLATQKQAESK